MTKTGKHKNKQEHNKREKNNDCKNWSLRQIQKAFVEQL
jgi:hypothetical protein